MAHVRSWVPRILLAVLTVLLVASAVVGATTGRGPTTRRNPVSASSPPAGTVTSSSTATSLPPESGYRGTESFCAVAPLRGTILYDGRSGGLADVLTVHVAGLPPNDEVDVNWSNNHIRVPVIGGFTTDPDGRSVQSSVQVDRLAEVRGVEIVLTAAGVPNPVLGRLEPC